MHIPDGLLSSGLLVTGYALSLSTALPIFLFERGRHKLHKISRISLVAAVVFVSSLIHIPMGFTTVHFTFAPLAGILLGPMAFFAVSLAVFMQWLLLGHGGLTTLGVNAFNIGFSALVAYSIFHGSGSLLPKQESPRVPLAVSAGIAAALIKVVCGSTFLILGGFPAETFYLVLISHFPVILGEGAICGFSARYLLKFMKGGTGYPYKSKEQALLVHKTV